MKSVKNIEHLKGVKALVRVDFNIPVANSAVTDDYRIRAALPTIDFLTAKGAKVILISHMESKDGGNPSLEPVANHLKKLGRSVLFVKNFKVANEYVENGLKDGKCVLLENLRIFEGEKANDDKFARELASLGDLFVNEAFSACHRKHASIVGVPKYLPSYAGLQLEKEVENLSRAFNPPHPFLLVLGGAKFETKLPLLEKFANTTDSIFVGGALAHDFFKVKGFNIGKSTSSESRVDLSGYLNNPKVEIPIDVVTDGGETKASDSLSDNDTIADAGAKTIELLKEKVSTARFILWNGPLGVYEDGFKNATIELARMIAESTVNGNTTSIVGGGDTIAAIEELNLQDKFTFISTGGGAMLEFLAKGSLPGIEALKDSQ